MVMVQIRFLVKEKLKKLLGKLKNLGKRCVFLKDLPIEIANWQIPLGHKNNRNRKMKIWQKVKCLSSHLIRF